MKKQKVNPNEAPEGYIAVEYIQCKSEDSCAFNHCAFSKNTRCGNDQKCCPDDRKDKCQVVFIKKT